MEGKAGREGGTTGGETSRQPARGSHRANILLVAVSVLIGLVGVELCVRVLTDLPVLKFVNWRTERVVMERVGEFKSVADPVLGWRPRPWRHHPDGYTTIAYGIRQNFAETTVRTGGVLAVGDSFTEGWEVKDSQSWPAQLEKRIGVPVVNAGVGAYGTDQIILRAEEMLPIVKPKILIVGFLEEDIFRAGHSVFGAPKPYFTLEKGELKFHPPEAMERRHGGAAGSSLGRRLRDVLGYSAALDHILSRLAPNYWYSAGARDDYRKVDIDAAAVTCALLRRLKMRADADGIRMLLMMQYHAFQIIESDEPGSDARRVVACAKEAGIRVVDQFAPLDEIERAKPQSMREYYTAYGDDLFGHMTAKGNAHAAALIEKALSE